MHDVHVFGPNCTIKVRGCVIRGFGTCGIGKKDLVYESAILTWKCSALLRMCSDYNHQSTQIFLYADSVYKDLVYKSAILTWKMLSSIAHVSLTITIKVDAFLYADLVYNDLVYKSAILTLKCWALLRMCSIYKYQGTQIFYTQIRYTRIWYTNPQFLLENVELYCACVLTRQTWYVSSWSLHNPWGCWHRWPGNVRHKTQENGTCRG